MHPAHSDMTHMMLARAIVTSTASGSVQAGTAQLQANWQDLEA